MLLGICLTTERVPCLNQTDLKALAILHAVEFEFAYFVFFQAYLTIGH